MTNSQLIELLSRNSDAFGNLIIEFLEEYDLLGTFYATNEQLTEFARKKNLI